MVELRVRHVPGGRRGSVVVFGREEGKIMDQVWKNKAVTPKDIKGKLRISLSQANVMLDRLVEKGLVAPDKPIRTGSRGRPSIAYHARVSREEFGDMLAEDLRLALLDVDEKFGLSRTRVQTFVDTLRARRE